MAFCFNCSFEFPATLEIFRTTECPSCKKDAHVCKNCRHYAPGAHWDCRESVQEQVKDKERSNFCDYFSLSKGGTGPASKAQEEQKQARARFTSLFNDSPGE